MIFYPILLTLFFFYFLVLQIVILDKITFDIDFLKRGRDVGPRLLALVLFLLAILITGLAFLYLHINGTDRFLYFFTFLFLTNTFITFFLLIRSKSIFYRFVLASIITSVLVSATLYYQQSMLRNILTAGSMVWISPLFFKHFNIERIHVFIFLTLFTIFDIYNVYVLNPLIFTGHSYILLNGFVQFGRLALGMGDFFLSYIALGLVWRDQGAWKSFWLAAIISIVLLTINLIGFKHDIPFSIFILIPTLFFYLKLGIVTQITKQD